MTDQTPTSPAPPMDADYIPATRHPMPWRDFELCKEYTFIHNCTIPEAQDALFREANPLFRVDATPAIERFKVDPVPPMIPLEPAAHRKYLERWVSPSDTDATEAAVGDLRSAVKRRYLVSQCTTWEWKL